MARCGMHDVPIISGICEACVAEHEEQLREEELNALNEQQERDACDEINEAEYP